MSRPKGFRGKWDLHGYQTAVRREGQQNITQAARRARYNQNRQAELAAAVASVGPPARAGRYGGNQIPRGFVGMAGDRKFVDTAPATYVMSTTGTLTHISIVGQGVTVNSREGKAFRVTSCQLRGDAFAGTTGTVARGALALVWDYQPNKVLPALTDIWDTVTSDSLIKRENNARFKIVMYRRWSFLGNSTTPSTGMEGHSVDEFIKMPKDSIALCTLTDTTGVIGNRVNGALYVCTLGDVVTGATAPSINLTIRTNFMDVPG